MSTMAAGKDSPRSALRTLSMGGDPKGRGFNLEMKRQNEHIRRGRNKHVIGRTANCKRLWGLETTW